MEVNQLNSCNTVNTVQIQFEGIGEMLPMGGPLTGRLKLNDVPLEGFFGTSYRYSEDGSKLLLPRIYVRKKGSSLLKNWSTEYTIVAVDLENFKYFESVDTFSQLYIHRMEDDNIFCFTDETNCKSERIIRFNDTTFRQIQLT